MASVHVLRAGLLTTIQDQGRWGYQAQGVSVAGPMDPYSHRLANALAGNPPDAAALEVTFVGPELRFDDERRVAVAGAEFEVLLDGRPVVPGQVFVVAPGGRVRFGRRGGGARAYLAVNGGIEVPRVLGSRATHLMSAVGGLDGRAVRAGDVLPLGSPRPAAARRAGPAGPAVAIAGAGPAVVRVLAGPQEDRFLDDALAVLESAPFTVGAASDRTGFRLEGPLLRHRRGGDIISDATPLGTLQVPGSGQPILLMADRQTTGGYAKLATVISADISVAGQLGPGDAVSFRVCSRQDAMAALIDRERRLMALERP